MLLTWGKGRCRYVCRGGGSPLSRRLVEKQGELGSDPECVGGQGRMAAGACGRLQSRRLVVVAGIVSRVVEEDGWALRAKGGGRSHNSGAKGGCALENPLRRFDGNRGRPRLHRAVVNEGAPGAWRKGGGLRAVHGCGCYG